MLAAPRGKSGKTVLTLGLLRMWNAQGIAVKPFKKGPDFIDPGWHGLAAGLPSRNLDGFFMTPSQQCDVVRQASAGCRLAVIEAAMGLYDGLDVEGSCSSAEVAKATSTPVVLVMDVTRTTRTAAALVMGLVHFDPDVAIKGVILNQVAGSRQERLVRSSIESACNIPVLGALPKDERMTIPDRHLGLISSTEAQGAQKTLDGIAALVASCVDHEAILAVAEGADPLPKSAPSLAAPAHKGARPLIAVIRDDAFCFYYEENFEALAQAGARLVFVDSLRDASLPPDVCALYIGGGFPETFAARLEGNAGFRASVRAHASAGMPVHAECGGLMYLARRLVVEDKSFEMAGVLAMDTQMRQHRLAHGYSVMRATEAHPWIAAGTLLKGHEFHYSQVSNLDPRLRFVFESERGFGIDGVRDGICQGNVVATYTHVNALASPAWAQSFVEQARRFQKR